MVACFSCASVGPANTRSNPLALRQPASAVRLAISRCVGTQPPDPSGVQSRSRAAPPSAESAKPSTSPDALRSTFDRASRMFPPYPSPSPEYARDDARVPPSVTSAEYRACACAARALAPEVRTNRHKTHAAPTVARTVSTRVSEKIVRDTRASLHVSVPAPSPPENQP